MKTTTKLTTSKIKSITDEILLKVDKHMYYNHDHEERSCVMAGVITAFSMLINRVEKLENNK